ncbi:uncharacterized protein N7479_004212 [Penicillium vulpinum]|uniref:beta-glucosidase n=1 Tax=Penicillium vulpinum TaxID=29845 RepID=A0A1V6SCB6_9EURO|nr:uncharacterized protein N7479_004212 [Penicillium vulpinum]KAJ5964336.1 hypothetical protein N7479_004212 [Penicillium vulpinum]OQE11364.1 hypothetical protein PENVUL_c002G03108 [Penicillium vulpinum]
MSSLNPEYTFENAINSIYDGKVLSQVVDQLLSQLTTHERLSLLDGDVPFWDGLRTVLCHRYNEVPFVHGSIPRLGIPGIRFTDGPRGVVMGSSTAFPVAMARGATWDVDLERRIGDAIGREAKAQGANYFAGVCVNLPRHPAWGRIQETYSENPLMLGEFGLALTEGVQNHIMACVKHFALNSMENARFRVDVQVDEDVLHEVYLAHFRRIVEGGVASVMSAYNSVNGEWAGHNRNLLTDILRGKWGFEGFVLSDFIFGLRDPIISLQNGLDIEAPFIQQRGLALGRELETGQLDLADVDRSCLRILSKELEFAARNAHSQPEISVAFCDDHRALAREAAARSIVLLKNEAIDGQSVLPLEPKNITKIAVVGRLSNVANTGDKGSSQVFPPSVVTPLQGLQAAMPSVEFLISDTDSVAEAMKVASEADLTICIVGYDHADEGEYVVPALREDPVLCKVFPPAVTPEELEMLALLQGKPTGADQSIETGLEVGAGGDRKTLRLRAQDEALITAVVESNPRTVVSIVAAGAVIMESWESKVPAILMSWYGGSEGGHGLADILLGNVDASGRLPFSIPRDEAHLPFFDRNATSICYDRWFGQHLLDKLGVDAAFPFGAGLSYTKFAVSNILVESIPSEGSLSKFNPEEYISVKFTTTNTGTRAGRYVAQVYGLPGMSDFPTRLLMGFKIIDLDAGQSAKCNVMASLRPIQRWVNGAFTLPVNSFDVEVASFSGDPDAVCSKCVL